MNTKGRAAAGAIRNGSGNHSNHFFGDQTARLNYRQTGSLNQCKKCGSDDLRFAVDRICLRCDQRNEFFTRERAHGQPRFQQSFREAAR